MLLPLPAVLEAERLDCEREREEKEEVRSGGEVGSTLRYSQAERSR